MPMRLTVVSTSPKSPWWQTTSTPKQGFVLGASWVVFALGWWVTLVMDQDNSWRLVLRVSLALLATVIAVCYLVSAVLLRRRSKGSDEPGDGAVQP